MMHPSRPKVIDFLFKNVLIALCYNFLSLSENVLLTEKMFCWLVHCGVLY